MDEAALAITAIARGVSPLGRDAFSFFSAENNDNKKPCTTVYFCCCVQVPQIPVAFFLLSAAAAELQYFKLLCYYATFSLHSHSSTSSVLPHHQPLGHLLLKVEAGSITCTLSSVCLEYKMMGQTPTNLHMLTQNVLKK